MMWRRRLHVSIVIIFIMKCLLACHVLLRRHPVAIVFDPVFLSVGTLEPFEDVVFCS